MFHGGEVDWGLGTEGGWGKGLGEEEGGELGPGHKITN